MRAKRPMGFGEMPLFDQNSAARSRSDVLRDARNLHQMWKNGSLGGEVMPEDVHPPLPKDSDELALYFTLGMCLNYQRNSYSLWRSCTAAFNDDERRWIFDPARIAVASDAELAGALLHHRVALQPTRHIAIWRRNAEGLLAHSGGSVRNLFQANGFDIGRIKTFLLNNSKDFPYLCGPKIGNYWLYVMTQYMIWPLTNRNELSVAPDTHVMAASVRLGLLDSKGLSDNSLPQAVAESWRELLKNTDFAPIDLHTPLWLWSRAGFPTITTKEGFAKQDS